MVAGQATSDVHAAAGERRTGRFRQEKLTVHQLLRRGAERYVNEHRDGAATMTVQSVLAKTTLCRTSALGGRWYQCDDCDRLTKRHNSCGDRHCPQCSGGKRQTFSDRASKLILDGVDYYQVVFTLPDVISTMALANREEIAELLFHSAWKALKKTVETEQQYELAALMVLHTWNQKLDAHWHVHALVPGAGPSLVDGSWTESKAPAAAGYDDDRKYLVDAINLRRSFRKIAVAHLQRLRKNGKLQLDGSVEYLRCDEAWDTMIDQIESKEWVSYIEPPPTESSSGEHVVRYLTRYLTGGPISDHRIIAADDQEVTFWAREGYTTGGESIQVPLTLSTAEFICRWCLHIQPNQLRTAGTISVAGFRWMG
ncbi:IS91 family transposase [Stieleria neptunia]|nr:transposase [Stieleria neptunia]